jgi:N6-adenosine-specific RNA methylase IME4
MTCRVLVADPPWHFGDRLPGNGRGASKHYDTLSAINIMRFPLPPIADSAHLFLWRVASMVPEALDVVRTWGFTAKSELVWLKRTPKGKRWFGMGRQVRMEHEVCIIATRGRAQVRDRSIRSCFEAPAGRHSAKPDEFFEIVERLTGAPDYTHATHIELFARRTRDGWRCYGNEIDVAAPPLRRRRDRRGGR